MKRRNMVRAVAVTAAAPALAATAGRASAAVRPKSDPLAFDPDAYTTLTATIPTDEGEKTVTYRFHRAVTYVARPVDAAYQSLNVSVPVAVDGRPVDASRAPILFSNAVGGYMPSSTAGATGVTLNRPNPPLALAAGYVVVEPGARGRTLVAADGTYYGTAPAAIVDLKAAVRYLRHNAGRIPGDTERIVATGVSAGGALTSLLGATADDPAYEPYLREIGAADTSDAVFGAAPYCPITDLEHADMAYEWNWGTNPLPGGGRADPALSAELRALFAEYQASLRLDGRRGFGRLTARGYDTYLTRTYLEPSATAHLAALTADGRAAYLAANPWITWKRDKASFTWDDYLTHVGTRKKNVPSFDLLDLSSPENNLFGTGTVKARHFTEWSLRRATGDDRARLDADLPAKLRLMNPMPFLRQGNPHRARHWFIRVGAKDTDTSLTVVGNLAAALENLGDDVDTAFYWDGGHGVNLDAPDFVAWIGRTCAR
ncbi:subtype B tannase [Streptomyces sp. CRN 30]|uniref:subtype B tannase n=1 Tax=Streptomyces sp. CRN 30 TaxID=3075613 RepID=UPI002A7ED6F0|nr:subtype B tannase [Streptomyces sp. CRN 30]